MSKDANNRQRLAIHSLLRQSDFVDDSRDAALEPQTEPTPEGVLPAVAANVQQEQRADWIIQNGIYPSWNFLSNDPNGGLYGVPFGMGFDFNGAVAPGADDLGLIAGLDEQGMY